MSDLTEIIHQKIMRTLKDNNITIIILNKKYLLNNIFSINTQYNKNIKYPIYNSF